MNYSGDYKVANFKLEPCLCHKVKTIFLEGRLLRRNCLNDRTSLGSCVAKRSFATVSKFFKGSLAKVVVNFTTFVVSALCLDR